MAIKSDTDSERQLRVKLDKWWSSSSSSRKELDWKWFVYDLWVMGNHYAKWDRNTQQIVSTVRDKGKGKVVINKIYVTLRAVRNYALRNKPKAEVAPTSLEDDEVQQARNLNRYLDFLHEKLRMRTKLKASMWHSLKYSVGFWQVLWDEDADDGEGEVAVNVIDPYDLYIDPLVTNLQDARYLILAVRRNVWDLSNDSKYEKDEVKKIKDDQRLASSPLKERLLSSERGLTMFPSDRTKNDGGSVIVKEYWYKEYDKKGNKKIMLATMAGDRIIRKAFDTKLDQFPFFDLPSDIEPLSVYGTGWVKNMIPPNRLLDRLESQLAEYNDLMNRGKWIVDKGAGVRAINNENGQIIEKKRAFNVSHVPIAPLNSAIFQQITNANRYIEDIGGSHDAMMGRIPTGATSGRAIETLQVGDANNMSELVENVEIFLEDVYEYVLKLASEHYNFARNILPMTTTGEREFVSVIGESAKNQPEDATVIRKKNIIDVRITSWLATTTLARQEILKELYQLQVIDKQTVLDGYQIGNVADIIKRLEVERQEAMAEEVAQQRATAQGQETNGQATQRGARQAIGAIRAIINNQEPPPPEGVTEEFVAYIDQFLQSEEAQSLGSDVLQRIQAYRDMAIQSVQEGAQPAPQEQEAPPEMESR